MTPATRGGEGASVATIAGVRVRLRRGVRVADLRCGRSEALIALARAFPRSSFHGFDADPAAVALARRAAAASSVSDRVTFEVAEPSAIPADGFDLLVDASRLSALLLPTRD